MVTYDTVLIRYGELSTKGRNRRDFIRRLEDNLKYALRDYAGLVFSRTYDRIYIKLTPETPGDEVRAIISRVFGISSFSFTEKVAPDLEAIEERCLEIARENEGAKKTFKVITKRHDKTFPLNSDGINRAVAGRILANTSLKVDVHQPDLALGIEVREDAAYLTSEKIPGAGGYPAGINGRVMLLMSGGIDSPVAAYELMKRGLLVEAVHFASPPYTSQHALEKVERLAAILAPYQRSMNLHIVPFAELQQKIHEEVGDAYGITVMRRMMFRIAEEIARKNQCPALATGESLGQVASQTLESMVVINDVVLMPVLRPLVCMDKVEIMDLARRIGTYETSILPYADCCTAFEPKNPVTKPTKEKAEALEQRWDWQPMVEACVEKTETERIFPKKKEEEFL
jgi:thiamine biosynthesis protein ThiI